MVLELDRGLFGIKPDATFSVVAQLSPASEPLRFDGIVVGFRRAVDDVIVQTLEENGTSGTMTNEYPLTGFLAGRCGIATIHYDWQRDPGLTGFSRIDQLANSLKR